MRSIVVAFGLVASLALASTAYAVPIYGSVDTGTGYNFTSSCGTLAACEEATLAAALGVSINEVNLTKIDTSVSDWVYVDDGIASTNLVAFDFAAHGITDPLKYIIKFGNAVYDYYLYTNNASLQYALIDLGTVTPSSGKITISSISHISTVPESGSLSLLLSGLTALGLVSVRRSRSSR